MASIELRQYNLGEDVDSPINKFHMYLAFLDDAGNLIAEFHGFPFDRNTGDFAGEDVLGLLSSVISNQYHLKVSDTRNLSAAEFGSLSSRLEFFTNYTSYVIFNGTQQQVANLIETAESFLSYLVNSNDSYSLIGTNSNAVANSLVNALGLSVPTSYMVPEQATMFPEPPLETVVVGIGEFYSLAPAFNESLVPTGFQALAGNAFSLTGTSDADSLYGGAGSDELKGEGGDDRLVGRAGDDTLEGGGGTDTADYSNEAEQPTDPDATKTLPAPTRDNIEIIIDSQGQVSVADRWFGIDNLSGIEHIVAGGGDADVIRFLSTPQINQVAPENDDPEGSFRLQNGNDTILLEGVETLQGGASTDNIFSIATLDYDIDGIGGNNTIDLSNYADPGGVTVNKTNKTITANDVPPGTDVPEIEFDNIQHITGGGSNDIIFGAIESETLSGGAGDDLLQGGQGSDTIFGGAGNDTLLITEDDVVQDAIGYYLDLEQGFGAVVTDGSQVDPLNYQFLATIAEFPHLKNTSPFVNVDYFGSEENHHEIENVSVILDGSKSVFKNAGIQYTFGSDDTAADIVLRGDGGDNQFYINATNGADFDVVVYGSAGQDSLIIDIDSSTSMTFTVNDPEDIEEIIFRVDGVETEITGFYTFASLLLWHTGSNLEDADFIGRPVTLTTIGRSLLYVRSSAESNYDVDFYFVAWDSGELGFDLEGGTGQAALDQYAEFRAQETESSVIGQSPRPILAAPEGGSDEIGGTGADDLIGGTGDDVLIGNGGADTLSGGAGADTFLGGAGNDQVTGGAGADRFHQRSGDGADVLTDFESGVDQIDLSETGVYDFAQLLSQTTDQGGDAVIDLGGGDSLRLSGVTAASLQESDFVFAVNDPPRSISLSNSSLAENVGSGFVVGTVSAVDPEAAGPLSFALTDTAGGRFAIDGATGVITVADGSLLDFEAVSSHQIEVSVTDAEGAVSLQGFGISVTNANEAPFDLTLTSGGSIAENSETGATVATVLGADPDFSDDLTYSLVDNAGGRFAIDPGSDVITVADGTLLDYESATSHDVTVRVTDLIGADYDETFTIQVTDLDDLDPPVTLQGGNGDETLVGGSGDDSIDGGRGDDLLQGLGGNDTLFGDRNNDTLDGGLGDDLLKGEGGSDSFIFRDGDGNDTIESYNRFSDLIDLTATQIVSFSQLQAQSSQVGSNTVIQVTATDSITLEGVSPSQLLENSFLYAQVSGPPSDLLLSSNAVKERSATGTTVGTLSAVDPSAGETFTFALLDDAGGRFQVDASTGRLSLADGALIDYESATSHSITVEVTDSEELTYSESFTIQIQDVNEIIGTNSNNTLSGTTGNDYIAGLAGNDTIFGGQGQDTILDSAGNDQINGGEGADFISVVGGSDVIYGNAGNDTIQLSGSGSKTVYGGQDVDRLDGSGATGNLTLDGNGGNDRLTGGSGADVLMGGDGDDVLNGGAGADVLYGNVGNDQLYGGAGSDQIFGGQQDDYLDGDDGNDALFGNLGDDTFNFASGDDDDQIIGFAAGAGTEDVIRLQGTSLTTFNQVLGATVQQGNDAVINFANGDSLTLVGINKNSLHQDDFNFAA